MAPQAAALPVCSFWVPTCVCVDDWTFESVLEGKRLMTGVLGGNKHASLDARIVDDRSTVDQPCRSLDSIARFVVAAPRVWGAFT